MAAPCTVSPGHLAYVEDCRRRPTYENGSTRHTWTELCAAVRQNWEKYPTPRDWTQWAQAQQAAELTRQVQRLAGGGEGGG